ncbi:MAG: hypothetical protein WCT32_01080 [Patescibacteria group bacterium]|jgi:hypothetical protein
MRYTWFVVPLIAAATLAAGCKKGSTGDTAPKAPTPQQASGNLEPPAPNSPEAPKVKGDLIIFNQVGDKHLTATFAVDLQRQPSEGGVEVVTTVVDPSKLDPDLADLFDGPGWFPFAGRYAGLKMGGNLYLVRAIGQSRKADGSTEIELSLSAPLSDGQTNNVATLRRAVPNETTAGSQGVPEASWGQEREPVGCLEEAAVRLNGLSEFGVVVGKGVDINLLTTHNQRFASPWLPLSQWPSYVDVDNHRVYRIKADDYGWTHLNVKSVGEASGYGLDTPAWAGVIVYITKETRQGASANALDYKLVGEVPDEFARDRLRDSRITGAPVPGAKKTKKASIAPAKVDGTVIYVTQDSNGDWMTTVKSKTKPAWRPAERPQVRVEEATH